MGSQEYLIESLYGIPAECRAGDTLVLADINLLLGISSMLRLGLERSDLVVGIAVSGYLPLSTVVEGSNCRTTNGVELVVDGSSFPSAIWNDYLATYTNDYDYQSALKMRGISHGAISTFVTVGGLLRPGDRLIFASPSTPVLVPELDPVLC